LILAEKETLLKLRYQLNPHFLFNALSSIRGAVGVNSDIAREMVTTLSEFCRLTLSYGETEALTIGEEARLTRLYLRIEQIRLGDYLHMCIDAEPGVEEILIPSFTLQPLMENALKYGKQTSPQRLDISLTIAYRDQNRLIIEVVNSGRLMESKPANTGGSTGIGIENLRQRLDRFYSGDYALSIKEERGLVRVCIDVPAKRL
jgi:LytS/YehU family sensor histidine kinase